MDILRIVASFGIVVIHMTTFVHNFDSINTRAWLITDILNSLFRWCVPIFFMLSGITLLDYQKRYSTASFYKKRLLKVALPFVIWSFIFIVWQYKCNIVQINGLTSIIQMSIVGPAYYHLWFFYSIIGLYLITPILAALCHKLNKRMIWLFILFCVIQNILYPLINKFYNIDIGLKIPLATSYVDYFLLGWLLKDINFSKLKKYTIYVLGVIGVIITIWASYQLSKNESKIDLYFMGYETFPTFFTSIAVFVFFKSINFSILEKSKKSLMLIKVVVDSILGVYLIHTIVKFYYFTYILNNEGSIKFMTLGSIIVYLFSLTIIIIIRKIPIIKNIVP